MYLQEYVKYLICVIIVYSSLPADRTFTVQAERCASSTLKFQRLSRFLIINSDTAAIGSPAKEWTFFSLIYNRNEMLNDKNQITRNTKYIEDVYIAEFWFPKEKPSMRKSRGVWDLIFGRFRTCGSCVCGTSNRNSARLLGGEYTESHEFPWLTNVHVKSKLVSGILINDRYILTAASQLIGATAPEIKVSLGEYDRCNLDISSLNSSIETVIMYPEFNPDSHAHDLALVRLSRPIKFEKRISPVCLPNPGSTYLGQVGTVIGWTESKSTDDIDTRTCRPRKVGLPILGYSECIKSGIDPKNYHNDSGCIGIIGGNSIVCNNDVGSSLLYRSYSGIYDLVGILSDLNYCDDKPRTAVFTKIGPHLDWILQNTNDACYCTK